MKTVASDSAYIRSQFPATIAALIPAWQPPETLVNLVEELIRLGCGTIVVVDDGSGPKQRKLFGEIAQLPEVTVLQHAQNEGKGCALKTGFRHLLARRPDCAGVVTADADGQHTPADIARVASALADSGRFVLGARSLQKNVPLRSKLGNALTRWAFRLLMRNSVADTQTGLRGLPMVILPELVSLPGDRYEYEMTVLAHLCQSWRAPLEIPISTVYLDGNCSSHFNPLLDSARIYLVLLRLALQRNPVADLADKHAAY